MPVATTHDLTLGSTTVTKRYSRWDRGEPHREWQALQLVHAREPDLVPRPLDCDLGDAAPYVTMSRVPGDPLGAHVTITSACLDATVEAMTRLHEAVTPDVLADLPERWWGPAVGIAEIRAWAEREGSRDDLATLDPAIQEALAAGQVWIASVAPELTQTERPVFARADGNAANLIWDGTRVRVVDFEDSGVSDLAYEIADTVEHLSVWSDASIDADDLLDRFALLTPEQSRVREYRRVWALFWLLMLLPGNPAHHRNPAGAMERQATRLLALL
jgi:Ser/Thr protein kinase RdoA (MazF antagonist)